MQNNISSALTVATISDKVNAELCLSSIYLQRQGIQLNDAESIETLKATLSQGSIHAIKPLVSAQSDNISFLANAKYKKNLTATQAGVVLIKAEMLSLCPVPALVVADPYLAFAKLSHEFNYVGKSIGINPSAQIDETVTLGENVVIEANVVIGKEVTIGNGCVIAANSVIADNVSIGEQSHISSNVSIGHHCIIGKNVRIHSNTSIGSDGFGFAPTVAESGFSWSPIAQLGKVIIGDDVRVGANTCIDRGTLGDTVIEKGVIIDNLVQIAHNVKIGEYTAIAACTGISGSTTIGKYCVIAGGVGIAGHLTIVDKVTITGASVVTGSINKAGSYSSGSALMPTTEWRKAAVNFKQLAQSPFRKIQKELQNIQNKLNI